MKNSNDVIGNRTRNLLASSAGPQPTAPPYIYAHIYGRDSVVGIASRYGLDGPGIESQWGRDFPHLSRPALGPTQPPIQ